MISKKVLTLLLTALVVFIGGCQSAPKVEYSAFQTLKPRSILILPPTNDTVEVDAPYTYLSTLSKPVGEMGYYIFPVAIVDAFMKENGLTDPYEMHQIPVDKLREVFGADAVLKIQIQDFGQQYVLLSSNTVVKANAKLIHLETGEELWQGVAYASESSGDGGGGVAGMMISALIDQVIDSLQGRVREVAQVANTRLFQSKSNGFLLGPYYPIEPQTEQNLAQPTNSASSKLKSSQ